MKQEIVTFIQNYPASTLILFIVFCLSTVWAVLCLIDHWISMRKPKLDDGEDFLTKKEIRELIEVALKKAMDRAGVYSSASYERTATGVRNLEDYEALCRMAGEPAEAEAEAPEKTERTATGVRNSEREKERAVAYTFYNNRLAEAYASTKAAVNLALQFHDIGMTPEIQQRLAPLFQATIKAHMPSSTAAEADKYSYGIFRKNPDGTVEKVSDKESDAIHESFIKEGHLSFEVKSVWYEYKGGDPTPIKHETDPGEIKGSLVFKNQFAVFAPTPSTITAPEAAEKTGEAYKSNVATGIRSLPEIDLYNLPVAGKDTLEDIDALARRIVCKWNDSPKEKRPAVLRVCMNTIGGQILAGLLEDSGIPVEPKERP